MGHKIITELESRKFGDRFNFHQQFHKTKKYCKLNHAFVFWKILCSQIRWEPGEQPGFLLDIIFGGEI